MSSASAAGSVTPPTTAPSRPHSVVVRLLQTVKPPAEGAESPGCNKISTADENDEKAVSISDRAWRPARREEIGGGAAAVVICVDSFGQHILPDSKRNKVS